MAGRTVTVKLTAEVGSYIQGMKNAAAATRDLNKQVADEAAKNKKQWTEVGTGLLAFGAAVGAVTGLAVKRFADFDQAMSNVQAATHSSAREMESLRDAALDAGARTSFSASQAADGIEALAKAGVSTTAILNGGLNGALDLAAAGGLAVGDAAEIAATALTQFRLKGAQVPHVADLLAAAAGKAQGDVSDMGMALKQAGLVANSTGLSIEETTAGLAAFASAGLLGSDAGTSFKSMLQRLTPQSVEAQKKMDELGISAYDAQGKFIGLEAFAQNLQDSLRGLTAEQRNSALATIFGSDAVRGATVLYQNGAAGIADWTKKVDDAGYAQETAAIKLDNLKGDVEALNGSLETLFIKGGSGANGFLRELTQGATGAINTVSALPDPVLGAATAVGGLTAAVALTGGALLVAVPKVVAFRAAMSEMGPTTTRAVSALTGLSKALGVAGLIAATAVAVDGLVNSLAKAPPATGALTNSLADFLRTGKLTGQIAKDLGADFSDVDEVLKRASKTKYLSFDIGGPQGIVAARKELKALGDTLASMAQSGDANAAASIFSKIQAEAGAFASSGEFQKAFAAYTDAVAGAAAESKLAAQGQGEMGGAVSGATGEVVGQTQALSGLLEQYQSLSNQVLGLRGSERDFEGAVDDATEAVKKNGQTLDINTEKGRANEAALDGIASSANDVLKKMVESGAPIDQVSAKMATQRERLVKAAEAFGMGSAEAQQYADSVLRIPTKAQTEFAMVGAESAISKADQLRLALLAIPGTKNVTVSYSQVGGYAVGSGGGGKQLERASGGWVSGPGTATSDSISARLSNGEFVVNAAAASRHGQLLEAINGKRFADGGWVSGRSSGVTSTLPGTVVLRVGDREFTAYVDERAAGQVVAGANTRSAGGWV